MPTSMAPFHSFISVCIILLSINLLMHAQVVKGGTCSSNTKVGWFCKFTYLATSSVFLKT